MESVLYKRIRQLCNERGVSVTRLETELGFSTSTIQKWKMASVPNATSIIKIAQYFNVSTDYLLGVTDIASTAKDLTEDDDIISLQRARSRMNRKDRERMMQMLKIGFEYAFRDEDGTDDE
jgi:transcriptional regulator with XRE-family HTH domain